MAAASGALGLTFFHSLVTVRFPITIPTAVAILKAMAKIVASPRKTKYYVDLALIK
jgi:hypothetical protein